jgi:hypothetical protein
VKKGPKVSTRTSSENRSVRRYTGSIKNRHLEHAAVDYVPTVWDGVMRTEDTKSASNWLG